MKTSSMHKVLLMAALLVLIILSYIFFYLPHNWSRIELGMSRSQVVELVGEPGFDSGDIKGCFWSFGKPPVVFVLNVFFDSNGKATDIDVRQFLGPENMAYVRYLKWKTKS
jgi:outer membrane protein assembly factor BamE (lipoprotein component of BamABCDE complex)